jgi:hypothetical protein
LARGVGHEADQMDSLSFVGIVDEVAGAASPTGHLDRCVHMRVRACRSISPEVPRLWGSSAK